MQPTPWRVCRYVLQCVPLFCFAAVAFGQTNQPTQMHTNPPTAMQQVTEFIRPYEPVYFLMGPETPAAKFQFSLKVVPFDQPKDARVQPTVAYTQTSFWDILGKSSPFYDTSYKPSVFLYAPDVFRKTNWWKLDLQGGYQHESNGRGGDSSRSMNTIYFQPTFRVGSEKSWHLALTPRFWFYILDLSDNPDITDFRGYGNLEIRGGWDRFQLSTKVQVGDTGGHAGVQVDLSGPILRHYKFMPYFHIQYWNGYGETLLGYNKSTQSIRFGLGLVEGGDDIILMEDFRR